MGVGSTAGNAGQLMAVSGSIGGTSESASYTYDNYSRLVTGSQTSNGASAQRRFAYDRWGNRTGVWDATFGGNQIQSISLQQSGGVPTNQISSVTTTGTVNYTYDAAGNVTNDGVHSYTYDSENRLVSMDSGTANYGYDHQNRRYKKTIGSTVTHYVWEGGQVLGEYDGSTGAVQLTYWYAGARLFKKTGAATQVYLSDRLSTRLTLSDIGAVAGRQGHLPFGDDFAESGTQDKHHLANYERDGESGSDYAVNRQYAVIVGRFSRPDPLSCIGNFHAPQSLNRFAYVQDDPINSTDPLGLKGWKCVWKFALCLAAIYTYADGVAILIAACPETVGIGCLGAILWHVFTAGIVIDACYEAGVACGVTMDPPPVSGSSGGGGGAGAPWDSCGGDFWMANAACEGPGYWET